MYSDETALQDALYFVLHVIVKPVYENLALALLKRLSTDKQEEDRWLGYMRAIGFLELFSGSTGVLDLELLLKAFGASFEKRGTYVTFVGQIYNLTLGRDAGWGLRLTTSDDSESLQLMRYFKLLLLCVVEQVTGLSEHTITTLEELTTVIDKRLLLHEVTEDQYIHLDKMEMRQLQIYMELLLTTVGKRLPRSINELMNTVREQLNCENNQTFTLVDSNLYLSHISRDIALEQPGALLLRDVNNMSSLAPQNPVYKFFGSLVLLALKRILCADLRATPDDLFAEYDKSCRVVLALVQQYLGESVPQPSKKRRLPPPVTQQEREVQISFHEI